MISKKKGSGGGCMMFKIFLYSLLFYFTGNRDFLRMKKRVYEKKIEEIDRILMDLRIKGV